MIFCFELKFQLVQRRVEDHANRGIQQSVNEHAFRASASFRRAGSVGHSTNAVRIHPIQRYSSEGKPFLFRTRRLQAATT